MATTSLHARSRSPIPASWALSHLTPALLGLIGAVVAFLGSWNVSLWTDEAATITSARRTLEQLGALVSHHDAVHAFYYLLMHGWTSVFGFSEVALRLPSALAVGGAVAGVYVLAQKLDRSDVALTAAIIAIVLPRITWMGVEARSFGLSATIAVWATVALVSALERGRWRWVAYAVLVALGIGMNIYVALLVVAHAVTVAVLPGTLRARVVWLAAAVMGTLIASPVVVLAASQQGQLGDNRLAVTEMLRQAVVNQWFLGSTPTRVTSTNDGSSLWAVAALALAAVCWLAMAVAVVAAIRSRSRARASGVLVVVPWIVVPTVLAILYSAAVSPLYNARYFTFAAPAVALLTAVGLRSIPKPALRLGTVALIAVLAVPIYVSQRETTGKSGTDWSEAAALVARDSTPGQGVYFSPLETTSGDIIGRTTRYVQVAYPRAFSGLVDVTLRTTGAQDATLRGTSTSLESSQARLAGLSAVWIVRPTGYPTASASADDAVFAASGLREVRRWSGPMDTVLEFQRR